jgi:hypothetical protein
MSLLATIQTALELARAEQREAGHSPRGRSAAIVVTDLEKISAFVMVYLPGAEPEAPAKPRRMTEEDRAAWER